MSYDNFPKYTVAPMATANANPVVTFILLGSLTYLEEQLISVKLNLLNERFGIH